MGHCLHKSLQRTSRGPPPLPAARPAHTRGRPNSSTEYSGGTPSFPVGHSPPRRRPQRGSRGPVATDSDEPRTAGLQLSHGPADRRTRVDDVVHDGDAFVPGVGPEGLRNAVDHRVQAIILRRGALLREVELRVQLLSHHLPRNAPSTKGPQTTSAHVRRAAGLTRRRTTRDPAGEREAGGFQARGRHGVRIRAGSAPCEGRAD